MRFNKFPEEVVEVVRKCAAKHGNDIPAAVASAKCQIEALDCFDDVVDQLVTDAIRDMIYDARHIINVKIKRETGRYAAPAKVDRGSPAVKEAYQSVYNYNIAGKMLGWLYGRELEAIADSETAVAKGHQLNVELLRRIMPQVPEDQQVRQAIPEKKLDAILRSVRSKFSKDLA